MIDFIVGRLPPHSAASVDDEMEHDVAQRYCEMVIRRNYSGDVCSVKQDSGNLDKIVDRFGRPDDSNDVVKILSHRVQWLLKKYSTAHNLNLSGNHNLC